MSRTAVVIPLRGLHGGKSRLAPLLDPLQRTSLVQSMARHVLSVVLDAPFEGPVLLVTRDPDLHWLVEGSGPRVRVLCQPLSSPGMRAAIDAGRAAALADGADRLLVLPADLPLLESRDLRRMLASRALVVIAPDRCGEGTNALMLTSAPVVTQVGFHFGVRSRSRHEEEAARLGIDPEVVHAPGFEADLDTPADWAMLSAETRDHLLRVPDRLVAARESALLLEHA